MDTPYQWTKQVASHYGGTRNGLVVHWPAGIRARGEVRHQWHHVIDVLPTCWSWPACRSPRPSTGSPSSRSTARRSRYSLNDGGRPGPAHHAVLRDVRQPGHLPRGLDRGHQAPHAVAARRGRGLRRRRVGALRHDDRLDAGPRPRRRRTRRSWPSCSGCSSTRHGATTCCRSTTGVAERQNAAGRRATGRAAQPHPRTRRGTAARGGRAQPEEHLVPGRRGGRGRQRPGCWSRRAAGSPAGRCTSSTAGRSYAYNHVGLEVTHVRGEPDAAAGTQHRRAPVRLRRRRARPRRGR